jgi:hypothetical protein
MMGFGYAVVFAALLSLSSRGVASEDDMLERMRACKTQPDDARRLACYDSALGVGSDAAISTATSPTAPQNVPASRPAPTRATDERSAVERFGYRGDIAREEQASHRELETLQARIAALEWLPRGEFVITLDNGQVWRQKTKQSIGSLEPGDQVTIRAGSLGSFRLSGSSNRSTQVQRVK